MDGGVLRDLFEVGQALCQSIQILLRQFWPRTVELIGTHLVHLCVQVQLGESLQDGDIAARARIGVAVESLFQVGDRSAPVTPRPVFPGTVDELSFSRFVEVLE
ncbi:hypothetical protein [Nocardia abscessus]|uniref:hypothetical protein n=1 Tax=Nocardia abscessus TaxID=120957 RepID=UPI002457E580|nr:hypothetical protein [Nocardia abscessus]